MLNDQAQTRSLAGRRVLIIEDNEENRRLLLFILQLENAEVLEAEDAEKGISIAQREQPDLILMDMHMPGMDGLSATRLLRADPQTREIPIIIVTASAMMHDQAVILASGCDSLITKPIEPLTFASRIIPFLRPNPKN